MIEAICRLLTDAKLTGVTLTIRASDNGGVNVMLHPIGPQQMITGTKAQESELAQIELLRAALSQGLVVKGPVGHVDVDFTTALEQFSASLTPVGTMLNTTVTNLEAVQAAHSSGVSGATAKAKTTAKPTKGGKAAPPPAAEGDEGDEGDDGDDVQSEPADAPTAGKPGSKSGVTMNLFETGAADSL